MFSARLIVLVFLLGLCALAFSPVFGGGLKGTVGVNPPVLQLPFPNISIGGLPALATNQSALLRYIHPNSSLPAQGGLAASPSGRLVVPMWVGYAVLGMVAAGGVLFVLFREGEGSVYDLIASVSLLEEASKRFSSTYGAAKLGVLAEYYRRLRDLCARLGVKEESWEAPTEYLDRVATVMGLDRVEAKTFAEVFGRSRYSKGLSPEEERVLSSFMAHFLEAVRRRVELGPKV
ncbi:MAG: DUF4129 domain-containing protein [Thermoprotei archaeon]